MCKVQKGQKVIFPSKIGYFCLPNLINFCVNFKGLNVQTAQSLFVFEGVQTVFYSQTDVLPKQTKNRVTKEKKETCAGGRI